MAHKLPNPMVHVKCGTCFYDLTWSDQLETFECTYCLTKITHVTAGKFKTEYTDPKAIPCGQPSGQSYKKFRHLRQDNEQKKYFVVFSYIFFPCSLPKGHSSVHYFHYACRYSEETLEYVEYKSEDLP